MKMCSENSIRLQWNKNIGNFKDVSTNIVSGHIKSPKRPTFYLNGIKLLVQP